MEMTSMKKNDWAAGLSAMLIAMSLSACSQGLQQDPLGDQPDEIRNGVNRGAAKPAPKPTPLPSESLRIDTAEFYSFKETFEGSAVLSGRVLIPVDGKPAEKGVDYELNIENMNAFPGASFDAATGQFKWTPPRGFVDVEYTRNMTLVVSLNTKVPPVLSVRRTIPVFVTRIENDPEVLSVDGLAGHTIREGESRDFQVTVNDPDSFDTDAGRPRLLIVNNRRGANSAAALVSMVQPGWGKTNPTIDAADKTKWIFTLKIDSRGAEVTSNESLLSFGLIAVSRFGRSSAPMNAEAKFITSVRTPVISWRDTVNLVGGQEALINFSAYDPQGEGRMVFRFNRCATLPGLANCTCVQQSASNLLCSIRWKVPDVASPTDYVVEGVAENLSPVLTDTQKASMTLNGRIRVTPASKPVPSPTPSLRRPVATDGLDELNQVSGGL
jgi:hypothetical protein